MTRITGFTRKTVRIMSDYCEEYLKNMTKNKGGMCEEYEQYMTRL